MTEHGETSTASSSIEPSIETLPEGVRATAEAAIEGEIQHSTAYTCRKCGITEWRVEHDNGAENIVDGETGDLRMHHLADTSAGAFHLDGNDIDRPYMCDNCFDGVRFRGTLVIGTLPTGERTGYRADRRVVAHPYWELDTAPHKTHLDDALRTVIDGGRPEFDGKPMVDIRDRLDDERREKITDGEASVHAVVFGTHGAVFVPEREIDEAVGHGRSVNVDELPDSLRVEECAAHYKLRHTVSEAAASFDCTDFGNPDTFRQVLESVGLDPERDHYRIDTRIDPDDEDTLDVVAHVWVNDGLMVQTGNDPLSGEFGKPYANRDPEPGYASSIGIEGHEHAVSSLFREVNRHAVDIDGRDATGRGFI